MKSRPDRLAPWLVVVAAAACGQNAPTAVGDTDALIRNTAVPAGSKVSGTFAPVGPPLAAPARVDAGGHCVIDLRQAYTVSGSLSGTLDIDYRIITYGPCPANPPAPCVFDETWIAHGTFAGTVDGDQVSATFTYVANVRAGGDVRGTITLADGLTGALRVRGNFADGALSYDGRASPD